MPSHKKENILDEKDLKDFDLDDDYYDMQDKFLIGVIVFEGIMSLAFLAIAICFIVFCFK